MLSRYCALGPFDVLVIVSCLEFSRMILDREFHCFVQNTVFQWFQIKGIPCWQHLLFKRYDGHDYGRKERSAFFCYEDYEELHGTLEQRRDRLLSLRLEDSTPLPLQLNDSFCE